MAMDRHLVEKCVRFPWDVVSDMRGGKATEIDREILQSMTGEVGLDPVFQTPPHHALLQSIALPTIMMEHHTKDLELLRTGRWLKVPQPERQAIFDYYGLDPRNHCTIFHLVNAPREMLRLAAYMAATYAFSTYKVPMVVKMSDVVQEIAQSNFENTVALELMDSMGLLIVTDVVGIHRGLAKMTATVRSFFTNRMYKGKTTVFMDIVPPPIARKLAKGEMPDRDTIAETLEDGPMKAFERITALLIGLECYINFNIPDPARSLNECRTAISF